MGSYLSVSDEMVGDCTTEYTSQLSEVNLKLDELDNVTKYELIEYIKNLKPKTRDSTAISKHS